MVSKYFAAGFIQGMGENLKERQDYIRDMTQRKTDFLMQEGLKRRGQVMDARVEFQKATDFLTSRGMDKDKVVALLEENPDEVVRLAARGLTLEQKEGVSLSSEVLNKAVEVSSEYKAQAGSVSEALDLIMPIFTKSEYQTPEAQEKGIFAKLFGSPTEAIDRNVYTNKLLGEYTGADIAASMGSPLKKRGRMSGDVSVSYAGLGEPLSTAERNALVAQTIASYDDRLDQEIKTLRTSVTALAPGNTVGEDQLAEFAQKTGITTYDNQADLLTKVTERAKKLDAISEEKDKIKRFGSMVDLFGAGEAVSMSGGATDIFAPKYGFQTSTFEAIKNYGKKVPAAEAEEDTGGQAEGTGDGQTIINPRGVSTEGLATIGNVEEGADYFKENPEVQYAIVDGIVVENPVFIEDRRRESGERVGIPTETGKAETGFQKYKEATGQDLQIQTRVGAVLKGLVEGKYGERTGLRDMDVFEFFMGERPDLEDRQAVSNAYAKLRSTEASSKVLEMIKDNPDLLTELEEDPVGFVKKYLEG